MNGRPRERVVVVVPGLTERRQGEPEDIGRVVGDLEAASAEEVTDRVDAPGDVMDEEDADQASPEQTSGGAEHSAGEQVSRQRRQREPEQHETDEPTVDQAHAAVLVEVGGVLLPVGSPVL